METVPKFLENTMSRVPNVDLEQSRDPKRNPREMKKKLSRVTDISRENLMNQKTHEVLADWLAQVDNFYVDHPELEKGFDYEATQIISQLINILTNNRLLAFQLSWENLNGLLSLITKQLPDLQKEFDYESTQIIYQLVNTLMSNKQLAFQVVGWENLDTVISSIINQLNINQKKDLLEMKVTLLGILWSNKQSITSQPNLLNLFQASIVKMKTAREEARKKQELEQARLEKLAKLEQYKDIEQYWAYSTTPPKIELKKSNSTEKKSEVGVVKSKLEDLDASLRENNEKAWQLRHKMHRVRQGVAMFATSLVGAIGINLAPTPQLPIDKPVTENNAISQEKEIEVVEPMVRFEWSKVAKLYPHTVGNFDKVMIIDPSKLTAILNDGSIKLTAQQKLTINNHIDYLAKASYLFAGRTDSKEFQEFCLKKNFITPNGYLNLGKIDSDLNRAFGN